MAYEIPYDSNYGEWYGTPQDVTRLSAMLEQSLDEDGYPIGIITASWNMPDNGGTFVAQLSTDGTDYHIAETNIRQNGVVLVVEANTDYYLKIITVLGSQQSSGVVSSLLSSGVTIVPPTPTVVAVQGGMQINVGSVPFGYNAVISISDGTDTTVLYTTNMITIYNCDAGTYSVSTAYSNASNDVGTSSSSVSVTVSELATADDYVEKTSADYIKSASVNAGGDTLTLTKGDDTTVTFQGGGGGGGSYTAGDGIDISNDTISLETASTTDIGGVIVGSGLSIDANGVLSATGGGGSGSGNASGVKKYSLWSNSSGWSSGYIDLANPITDYDFIEFIYRWASDTQYRITHIVDLKQFIGLNYSLYGYDTRAFDFTVTSSTRLTKLGGNYVVYEINGINVSKNLTEQMSSNVLYENASGWTSGAITLSDSITNYDDISILFSPSSATNYISEFRQSAQQLHNDIGNSITITGYGTRFFDFVITSDTVFTFSNRTDYKVFAIKGIKYAQGGYSGIVTDARMTVKSGVYTHGSTLNGNSGFTQTITFDSPMPDTNYEVLLSRSFADAYWANVQITAINKTVNSFDLQVWNNAGNQTAQPPKVDWIAIRPNSYTREGMVEDILFSNASGVNSGTISLSGNISDYDLVQIRCKFNVNAYGGQSTYYLDKLITATDLLTVQSSELKIIANAYNNSYILDYSVVGDNAILIRGIVGGVSICKITGIKFGRYVSGVAVDTTVTQGSSNVVTSGAVYTAIQQGGGGGGGSYTAGDGIDISNYTISLETASANDIGGVKVGSGLSIDGNGVLSATGGGSNQDVFTLSTHSIDKTFTCQNTEYLSDTTVSKEFIFKIQTNYKRCVYKEGSDLAICGIANVGGVAYGIFLSLSPNGVVSLHTNEGGDWIYDRIGSLGTIHDDVNNIDWYYSGNGQVGQPFSSIVSSPAPTKPIMSGTYSSIINAATQLLEDASPQVIEVPIKEDLFNPTNCTVTSGDTITNNTLKSLINGYRPIKVNNETYYFIKLDSGTYYYKNFYNTITVNSSWVMTITADGGQS